MDTAINKVRVFQGKHYFRNGLPICINQIIESFDTSYHSHDFWEMTYIAEGQGKHISGECVTEVSKGDMFLVPIGVSHVFRPNSIDGKEPLIVYNFIVEIEELKNFLRIYPGGKELEILLNLKEWRRHRDCSGRYYDLFQQMHFEYLANLPGREVRLYNGLMELLLYFYCKETRTYSESTKTRNYMQEVLSIMNSDYHMPLQVKDMAIKMGVGERQFQRIFYLETNMTFKNYLQGIRINHACRLLVNTNRKVLDIAESVGYQDIPYFNKLFKEKVGMTPREYRRKEVKTL